MTRWKHLTPGLQWVSLMLLTPVSGGRDDTGRIHYGATTGAKVAGTVTDTPTGSLPVARDLVVVAVAATPSAVPAALPEHPGLSKPIVVVTKLRKDVAQPAPPRRPGQIGTADIPKYPLPYASGARET